MKKFLLGLIIGILIVTAGKAYADVDKWTLQDGIIVYKISDGNTKCYVSSHSNFANNIAISCIRIK